MVKLNRLFRMFPFYSRPKPKIIRIYTVVIIVAVIGTVLFISSSAQTPYASVNASRGTLAGEASKLADSSASDGYKVIFGTNGSSGGSGSAQTTGCFSSPSSCGYPDPTSGNVGLSQAQCAALPTFQLSDVSSSDYYYKGSGNFLNIDANNVTIEGYNLGDWQFNLDGVSGTVFNDDCLSTNGDNASSNSISGTSNGTTYASHTTVKNSTIVSQGCSVTDAATTLCTGPGVNEQLIGGAGTDSTITNNILVGAVEDINGAGSDSTISDNYIVANGYQSGGHTENIYNNDVTGLTISHNTLLNPYDETAEVFTDNGSGACVNSLTVTDNLMAGGGYFVYPCSQATSQGSSKFVVTNNDLARCAGTSTYDSAIGGYYCAGGSNPSAESGSSIGAGRDTHGYWPGGGFFGVQDGVFCSSSGTTWAGNYWDDTGDTVAC
jgi:hypothetical protein